MQLTSVQLVLYLYLTFTCTRLLALFLNRVYSVTGLYAADSSETLPLIPLPAFFFGSSLSMAVHKSALGRGSPGAGENKVDKAFEKSIALPVSWLALRFMNMIALHAATDHCLAGPEPRACCVAF